MKKRMMRFIHTEKNIFKPTFFVMSKMRVMHDGFALYKSMIFCLNWLSSVVRLPDFVSSCNCTATDKDLS